MQQLKEVMTDAAAAYGYDIGDAGGREHGRWYEQSGDFERDGVLICGLTGLPKEVVYEDGVRFPVVDPVTHRQLFAKEVSPTQRFFARQESINACFCGEFRDLRELTLDKAVPDTQPEAIDLVKRQAKGFYENHVKRLGRGLVIYGENGRGKTFLLSCLANELLRRDYKALMTSTRRLESMIDRSFGSLNSVIDDYLVNFDAVFLDDLFRNRNTEKAKETIFALIDALYKRRVTMMISTNASRGFFASPPEDYRAVVDRIKERCEFFELKGPNRRQEAWRWTA